MKVDAYERVQSALFTDFEGSSVSSHMHKVIIILSDSSHCIYEFVFNTQRSKMTLSIAKVTSEKKVPSVYFLKLIHLI